MEQSKCNAKINIRKKKNNVNEKQFKRADEKMRSKSLATC